MPRIKEDQAGFLEKTKGKGYHVGYYNPLFKGDPESKQKARDVKRSFSEEADQTFFQSLSKIHWLQGNYQSRLQKILNSGGKDEISTSGYKPGVPLVSNWGSIGVELQGRTTLAANDMDYIYSGYVEDMDPKEREKYKSSGIPKRATGFGTNAVAYGLDKKSFKGGQRSEIILDNWKPVALILSNKALNMLVGAASESIMPSAWFEASGIAECVEYFYTKVDLPVKNQKGEIQPKESIMNLVDKTLDRYDAITQGDDILTSEGGNMSKFDLKQFIMEVLADPQVGQRFKSTRAMPITMSSGRDVKITDVRGSGPTMEITFEITDRDGKVYTIDRRWSDILNLKHLDPGEWFEPVQEQKKVTGTYGGKTYGASPGSVSAIKKSGDSAKKAVAGGKFNWASNPYAAAQAAHIVSTGEPTVKKGSKKKNESEKKEAKTCDECGAKYEGAGCNECGY